MDFSDLMVSQARALLVMFSAGILVESFWQLKKYITGIAFWICSAVTVSMFLYYSTYGRITLYCVTGFFAGLILWKKICCGIIKQVWLEKEEGAAENSKTTARSSISIRPESKGWRKDKRKKSAKKKR